MPMRATIVGAGGWDGMRGRGGGGESRGRRHLGEDVELLGQALAHSMAVESRRGDVDGQAEGVDVDDVGMVHEVSGQQMIVLGALDPGTDLADVVQRIGNRILGVHKVAAGNVDRCHEVGVLAGRGRHHEGTGQGRFEPVREFGVAEVEQGRLGE